jgi:hypothetical protein
MSDEQKIDWSAALASETGLRGEPLGVPANSYLAVASRAVGLDLEFPEELAGLPCLRGSDGKPVPAFQVIEEIDGHVDLEAVAKELPTLSLSQIADLLALCRRMMMENDKGVDIDDLEDDFWSARGLADELKAAGKGGQ